MRTTRILACATAAVCFAAIAGPARAQETWDETLKSTLSSWLNAARNTARIATLNPVSINMCWGSDKNALVADPAVVAGFQKIRGNEKVTVTFPRDSSGTLLGSGDIMNQWESGSLNCSTVSPDASILAESTFAAKKRRTLSSVALIASASPSLGSGYG